MGDYGLTFFIADYSQHQKYMFESYYVFLMITSHPAVWQECSSSE